MQQINFSYPFILRKILSRRRIVKKTKTSITMCNQNNKKKFIVIKLFSAVVERAERVVLKNKQYINLVISNSCRHHFLFFFIIIM